MLSRRQILGSAAVLVLSGCAGGAPSSTLQKAISDAGLIASGLAGAVKQLVPEGISSNIVAKATAVVTDIQEAVAAMASADSASSAQPLVTRIETDFNALVGVFAGLPLPPPLGTAIQAAAVLLPVIETAVGLIVSGVQASARSAMTPVQARAALMRISVGGR